MTHAPSRSYRALLGVPFLARALLGMQVVRIAQSMIGITLVLLALTRYDSAELAGLITFVGIAPGLLTSPITGALLDRHGRIRLIQIDYLVALGAYLLIGLVTLGGDPPAWLLLVIAGVASLTGPLSQTGLRTLFPLMAPRHLWEPLNAVDSNGWVVATIVGPPFAAVRGGAIGAPATLLVTAALYGSAILVIRGVPEPATATVTSGRILVDAWLGLRYAWSNRTIRGLGFAITTQNIAWGFVTIVVPLIVLRELGLPEQFVGLAYAAQGVAGAVAGLWAGRLDTRGRERRLIALPQLIGAPVLALLLIPGSLIPVIVCLVVSGIVIAPADVAMFTLRQRRTDPAWMGRAFAISMSMNFAGFPIGSALAGFVAARSIPAAVVAAVIAAFLAAAFAWTLIPDRDREFDASGADAEPRHAVT